MKETSTLLRSRLGLKFCYNVKKKLELEKTSINVAFWWGGGIPLIAQREL